MSSINISSLPPASLPLSGTEAIPMQQGILTCQATVQDLFLGADLSFATNIPVNSAIGTLSITHGGTGESDAYGAINALLPPQQYQANNVLTTNGLYASWSPLSGVSGVSSITPGTTGVLGLLTTVIPSTGIGAVRIDLTGQLNFGSATSLNAVGQLPPAFGGTGLNLTVAPGSNFKDTLLGTPNAGGKVLVSNSSGTSTWQLMPTTFVTSVSTDETGYLGMELGVTGTIPGVPTMGPDGILRQNDAGSVTLSLGGNINLAAIPSNSGGGPLAPLFGGTGSQLTVPSGSTFVDTLLGTPSVSGMVLSSNSTGLSSWKAISVGGINSVTQNNIPVDGLSSSASTTSGAVTIGLSGHVSLSGMSNANNGFLPYQCGGFPTTSLGLAGQILTSNGTTASWVSPTSGGGVSSVTGGLTPWYGLTVTTNQTTGAVIASIGGTLNLTGVTPIPMGQASGTLAVPNGGTGSTTAQGAINTLTSSSGVTAGRVITTDGTNVGWSSYIPGIVNTVAPGGSVNGINVSVAGTSAITVGLSGNLGLNNLTTLNNGILPIQCGGTSASTLQTARNNLIGFGTTVTGAFLTNNGTDVIWSDYVPGTGSVTSVGVFSDPLDLGLYLSTGTADPITGSGTISIKGTVNADQLTGLVPLLGGGTGAASAQAAINALTAVSGVADGRVLTSVAGNATWSAPISAPVTSVAGSPTALYGLTVSIPSTTGNVVAGLSGTFDASSISIAPSQLSGAVPIPLGGTGATDATTAFNNLAPAQSGATQGFVLSSAITGSVGQAYWVDPNSTIRLNSMVSVLNGVLPSECGGFDIQATGTAGQVLASNGASGVIWSSASSPQSINLGTLTSGANGVLQAQCGGLTAQNAGTNGLFLKSGGTSPAVWAAPPSPQSIVLSTLSNGANGMLPAACGGFTIQTTGTLGQVLSSNGSSGVVWGDPGSPQTINLSTLTPIANGFLPDLCGGFSARTSGANGQLLVSTGSSGTTWITSTYLGAITQNGSSVSGISLTASYSGNTGTIGITGNLNLSGLTSGVNGVLPTQCGGVPSTAGGTSGYFLQSTGTNTQWQTITIPNPQNITLSTLTNITNGLLPFECGGFPGGHAIGPAGYVLTSTGTTGTWAAPTGPQGINLSTLTSATNGVLPYACGGLVAPSLGLNGQALLTNGTTASWGTIYGPQTIDLSALTNVTNGFLPVTCGGFPTTTFGTAGQVLTSTGSSATWQAAAGPQGINLSTLTNTLNGFLPVQCGGFPTSSYGAIGTVLTSTGSGAAWQSYAGPQSVALGSLTNGTNGVLPWSCGGFITGTTVGSAGTVLTSTGTTATWQTATGPQSISLGTLTSASNGVLPVQCGAVPTGGTSGYVLTTDGTVASWQATASVNLASPGPIGGTTPSTGAFTSLTSTLDVTFNGVRVGRGLASVATNTAVGTGTLATITTGATSTAVGCQALNKASIASGNTAVGNNALSSTITGNNNTAVGNNALGVCTTSYNVAVGASAGAAITTGTSNVAVGFNSLLTATTSAGQVAVGYGALQLATGTQNVSVGYNSLSALTTGTSNTAVGYLAMSGSSTTATSNVAVGISSLLNGNGGQNVAVGGLSLGATGNTAANNVAVGYQSMQSNTTGTNNVGIGTQALQANLSGGNNVAVGTGACCLGTNASAIVGIGNTALFNNTTGPNTAVGNNSLKALTSGNNNVAVGDNAGLALTTGTNSTFIGHNAGLSLTTGSGNAFIGNSSGSSVTTGSNNVVLGGYTGASVGGSFDLTTATGYIVLSAGDGTGRCIIDSSNNLILGNKGQNGLLTYSTQSTAINSNGSIYCYGTFATTTSYAAGSPSYFANYNSVGTLVNFFSSGSQNAGSINVNAASTTYGTTSDYRLKNDVVPLTGSGDFIDALKPVSFKWNTDGSKCVGFIAHEFAEVCPSAVSGVKDSVDELGEPIYQTMQASNSETIANIVLELQLLRKRLYIAEKRIEELTHN